MKTAIQVALLIVIAIAVGTGAGAVYGTHATHDTNVSIDGDLDFMTGPVLLDFTNNHDEIDMGSGHDKIDLSTGNDTIRFHNGTDKITYGNGYNSIEFGDGVGTGDWDWIEFGDGKSSVSFGDFDNNTQSWKGGEIRYEDDQELNIWAVDKLSLSARPSHNGAKSAGIEITSGGDVIITIGQ